MYGNLQKKLQGELEQLEKDGLYKKKELLPLPKELLSKRIQVKKY